MYIDCKISFPGEWLPAFAGALVGVGGCDVGCKETSGGLNIRAIFDQSKLTNLYIITAITDAVFSEMQLIAEKIAKGVCQPCSTGNDEN